MTDFTQDPEAARFWSKVKVGDRAECWPWQRARNRRGYGIFSIGTHRKRSVAKAHRVAYALAFGPIPAGQVILHRCDNPACCNPYHLQPGSQAENVHDCLHKGRLYQTRTQGGRYA